jgi:DNA polymerase III subunit alpha
VKYVSLHHHTTFSYMDGFGTPAQHLARSAELGMTAQAVTEHGNVSSHAQFEKAAAKVGVKPIFGLEAYTALGPGERRKFHLTILAMNDAGYHNLNEITSRSWSEGFYQWPTVFGPMLAEHNEGLIVLSGCADSLLACSLLGGKSIAPDGQHWEAPVGMGVGPSYERAKATALRFKELFGDRYYLETQMFPELERSKAINGAWERLSSETGIPLVATADVHYPHPDDNEMQVILHAAGRGAGSVDAQSAGWEYDIRLTHPSSDRVAYERMRASGLSDRYAVQALRATAEIADRCDVVLPKAGRLRFPLPDDSDISEYIWSQLRKGWAYRVRHGNRAMVAFKDKYVARLNYEMEAVTAKGFLDYFMMMSDLIIYAKENGVAVGPGRGSSASSLVCYLLRITELDPLQFPLMLFERFIAPDRADLPDIDTDFDDERRGLVRAYAIEKYGRDKVGNIANYTKFRGKSALKSVGRVFPEIPKYAIENAGSMVIERSGGDSRVDAGLVDTVEMFPAVREIFDKYPDLWKATRLEGNYSGMSVHAAGLVITERPINEVCAQYTRTRKDPHTGEQVTVTVVSVDKKDGEYLGLMKADLLGLSTMGMIRIAIDLAGVSLEELYAMPLDDPKVIDAFRRNDVVGVFQFEGRATRLVNREVAPDSFWEMVDINGLSRPGPLFSGTTADYIGIKMGRSKVEKLHPLWDAITEPTKGAVIYQEQVLRALREIGLIPVDRVNEIRKIISLKLGEAQLNRSSEDFINGAATHGIKRDLAQRMWGRLVTSATYSFVYAHSAAYAVISYWCMWLKVYHPYAFYTAALRKAKMGSQDGQTQHGGNHTDNFKKLIKDAGRHGIPILGVSPNDSEADWAIAEEREVIGRDGIRRSEPRSVRAGWLQVPGIGPAKAAAIMKWRDEILAASPRAVIDMEDLIDVNGIGPAMMRKILAVDPLDPFGIRKLERELQELRRAIHEGEVGLPIPTHTSDEVLDAAPGATVVWIGKARLIEYKDFIEDERARSGDDLEVIKARMKDPHLPTGAVIHGFDDGDEDVYLRVHRSIYRRFKRDLEAVRVNESLIVGIGKKSKNSFGASVYIDKLYYLDPPEV